MRRFLRVRGAACDVRLGPLKVLAGPNAAGKSNFLDALRFVRDALHSSPEQALEPRGGLEEILHRSSAGEQADFFRIRFKASIPALKPTPERPTLDASYLLEVGAAPEEDGRPAGRREGLSLHGMPAPPFDLPEPDGQHPIEGWWESLALPKVSRRNREACAVSRCLCSMRFYELHTPMVRDVDQTLPKPGDRETQVQLEGHQTLIPG
jgi:hypothetical protein